MNYCHRKFREGCHTIESEGRDDPNSLSCRGDGHERKAISPTNDREMT